MFDPSQNLDLRFEALQRCRVKSGFGDSLHSEFFAGRNFSGAKDRVTTQSDGIGCVDDVIPFDGIRIFKEKTALIGSFGLGC